MKLFSKAAGVIAAALLVTGGIAPVAQGQALQVVTPEQQESYVQQFHHDGDTPPVVDGVGGYTEEEVAEIHEAIRQAQDSGAPNEELIPGEMWSDKVELPATIDKAAADEAEIAIAQQQSQPQARGLATAAACQTFWPSPYQVCGAILERYIQQGAQFGWMLLPTEGQALNPDGQGYRQRFMNGFIYWHPTTGAHAVNNYNAQVWERNGWETGWMGYPTGGEVPVSGSNPIDGELNGWVQTFQGGRVYRSPVMDGVQVASINGLILDRWLALGGPNSVLGFPIADEAATADGVGRFSIFQHGSIYWHPNTGAHSIYGSIFNKWANSGFEVGKFGYPIAEPEIQSGLKINQEFQFGELSGYAEPIPSIIALLPLTESELDEAYDLLVADFSERGISVEEGFHEAFTRTKESYDYTLEQIAGSIGSSSKVQQTVGLQQFEPNAVIDPQKCTFIAPGNERTNRGDIFYSAAIRYGIINHGHNGIFTTKGSSDPRNIETVEAVGAPDGVMRLSGANRRGVCRPVYLSVKTTDDVRSNAASFAESKIGAGYNSNFLTTRIGSLDKSSYNRSQLVWAAFKRASGGGLDIGERFPYEPYQPAVYPLDILNSHNTVEIQ